MFWATKCLIASRNEFKIASESHREQLGSWILTKRALGEALGSPRETESGRSLADGSNWLLSKGPRGKGTDSAGDEGHFGVRKEGNETAGKKGEEGRV